MANRKLLGLLCQGVERWNDWRQRQYSGQLPNLLPGTYDKKEEQLDLDLSRISFCEVSLQGANFRDVNLSGAIFIESNLQDVDFSGANLSKANLRRADLERANLSGADLDQTDFSEAQIGGTCFGNIDLSKVKGLETVWHRGPSSIGIDTVIRSGGTITEAFLQGAGIPDSFITYARSLINKPIEFYSCFISHSSNDESFARRLHADLQSRGVRCWFAPEDLKIGDHYHQRIDESIRLYDKLVLILSEHAVQSAWVEREVVTAREKEDRGQRPVLFPVRLDDAVMDTTKAWAADVRRRWHIGDFTRWKYHDAYQQAFNRLLRDLKAEHDPKN
jgi:hypothetical protein